MKESIYAEAKLRDATALIRRVVDQIDPERIILFGSVAQKTAREGSDVDLLVLKSSEKSFKERMNILYTEIERDIEVDMIWYTPEELSKMKHESSFIRTALKGAEVIYERKA